MPRTIQYYRLAEAEKIKKTYSSWIGRQAHIGHGRLEILTSIVIKMGEDIVAAGRREKGYRVKFEFANKVSFDAIQFLVNNGLTPFISSATRAFPYSKKAS